LFPASMTAALHNRTAWGLNDSVKRLTFKNSTGFPSSELPENSFRAEVVRVNEVKKIRHLAGTFSKAKNANPDVGTISGSTYTAKKPGNDVIYIVPTENDGPIAVINVHVPPVTALRFVFPSRKCDPVTGYDYNWGSTFYCLSGLSIKDASSGEVGNSYVSKFTVYGPFTPDYFWNMTYKYVNGSGELDLRTMLLGQGDKEYADIVIEVTKAQYATMPFHMAVVVRPDGSANRYYAAIGLAPQIMPVYPEWNEAGTQARFRFRYQDAVKNRVSSNGTNVFSYIVFCSSLYGCILSTLCGYSTNTVSFSASCPVA
jgi:hypothetical protein